MINHARERFQIWSVKNLSAIMMSEKVKLVSISIEIYTVIAHFGVLIYHINHTSLQV